MKSKLFGMRRLALGMALSAATLLASCGGGSQVQTFNASRILVFGDEASVITSTGAKYSVNALATGGTLDCASFPIWVQSLASHYGLVFPQCNPTGAATTSQIYAAAGAKVADVEAQINAHLSNGGAIQAGDLATVMAGTNDVVEIFGMSGVDRTALATQRGANLAAQVNRLAAAGAKVLISTIPDVGLTPYAYAQNNITPNSGTVLHDLTKAFNDGVRGTITNNGREIGLMLADGLFQSMVTFPSGYTPGLANLTQASCAVALPNCTTATLGTDTAGTAASATTWLWADSLWPGPTAQAYIGSLAVTRVANNPF